MLLNSRLNALSVESKNAQIEVRTRKLGPSKVEATDSQGCAKIWAHPRLPFCSGFLPPQNIVFGLGQSRNPVKLVFDHHTIRNKPHNIQISPENRTRPVGHYTTSRRKITSVGGNLPLVAQFRVLFRPGLLTAEHSFLFLFLSPLFLPFLLSFLLSFPPFLLSFPPPSPSLPFSSPCCSHRLILSSPLLLPTAHVSPLYRHGKEPCMLTHGLPCVTHMTCHVSHMHAFAMHCDTWFAMYHTWFSMCHPHGSPCVAR